MRIELFDEVHTTQGRIFAARDNTFVMDLPPAEARELVAAGVARFVDPVTTPPADDSARRREVDRRMRSGLAR